MSTVQDTFYKIQDAKKRQRDIRSMMRQALKQSSEYEETIESIKGLREKKKTIEARVRGEFSRELDILDAATNELKGEQELMAHLVLTSLMKGEVIKVHDAKNYVYDPVVKVTFKKSDDQPQ